MTDAAELSTACDGAFIICGYVNSNCNTSSSYDQRIDHPHDPTYSIVNANSRCHSVATVALYIPSAGIYYSPWFVSDTSRLRAKGLWLGNHGLATKTVFQMLSSNSLRILKSSGYPDAEGQLWKFTDVYRIDIQGCSIPIPSNSVYLTGVHVSDNNICIPPDIMVGCKRRHIKDVPSKTELYCCLKERFVRNLVKSKSNRAGKKRYVDGSFIAFPEKFVENPLVIDSCFIENNQQVVIQIRESSESPVIGCQSSIRVQRVSGVEYSRVRQFALRLGERVCSLQGKSSVRDKPTSYSICSRFGLPLGFDGPMHALGMHVDLFNRNRLDPIHYCGTQGMVSEINDFAMSFLPLLKKRFHWECKVMQQGLHSFDEISPLYLGGSDGISLSINVSHNFANSSHYDSLDYGPSIVLWVLDEVACKNCDQYLVFNNVVQTVDGAEGKRGLMVKIADGMIMSFQGSSLRHGTTIRRDAVTGNLCPEGNVFGIHFGLNMPNITAFQRIRIDQYVRDMNMLLKMAIHDENYITYLERKNQNQNRRVRMSMIKYTPQKRAHINSVVGKITSNAVLDDEYEMSLLMVSKHYLLASSEVNKEVVIEVVQDKTEVMTEQFHIVKYEQVVPNWDAFYMNIWSHKEIVDRY